MSQTCNPSGAVANLGLDLLALTEAKAGKGLLYMRDLKSHMARGMRQWSIAVTKVLY